MRRALLMLLLALGPAAPAAAAPRLSSQAGILIDAKSGRVLYAKSAYIRRSPASTTKLLTAIVAVREGDLRKEFDVSRAAASVSGSSAHLRAGDRYTLRELLEGMLLRSGNDAAHAVAESVGGTMPKFAVRMNETAVRIGARQTHFVNPHGLTAAHHYTSASDLATIARTALRNPEIRRIVASQELTLTPVGREGRPIRNTNSLLGEYLGADGAKTGTTSAAGKCLVASATRGEVHLIAVVLKGGDRYGDARQLLDYGFSEVTGTLRVPRGAAFGRLPDGREPRLADDLTAPVFHQPLHLRVRLSPAPAHAGGVVGVASLEEGNQAVAVAPLTVGALRAPWYIRLLHRLGPAPVDRNSLHSL
ncbi:MAG: D-alanyl-D-alanine carboxypeptidase [Thermaerobacter sp.]|nr:D-alanyl-D-alanine carboxypeptidase [Thermaerobacter sp.]